jgi:hypothetical protein
MNAKEEIAAAIEEIKHVKQKDPSKTLPFEHDAVFNMLLSSIRKTSDDRKVLQCHPIPETSAKKNELAEGGYWGENWQWINRSDSRKGWVDISKIAGRLEKVLDDLTFLESRLEFYTCKLDGIVGKI